MTRDFSNIQSAWREIGGRKYFFRSKWEANYARYLQWQKEHGYILEWYHEPKTFWFEGIKRGVNNYKPDFLVGETAQKNYWVEVKGYYDSKSKTKIKRFKSYHPTEELRVIDRHWFSKNNEKMRILIKDWE